MELLQLHATTIDAGFRREYRLFQISDAHIVCADDKSSAIDRDIYRVEVKRWRAIKRDFAAIYGEFCDERYDTDPCLLLKCLMDHAVSSGARALLISGDLMERVTESTLRYLKNVFAAYPLPILLCPGNHCYVNEAGDSGQQYGRLRSLMPDPEFQVLDMGEFRIIAVDDAKKTVSDIVLARIREALKDPRPILLMLHVPLQLGAFAKAAADLLKDPCWLMTKDTCGENAAAFLQLVEDNANRFLAVLAGHVHGNIEAPIAPGLMQYTTSSVLIGKGREIIIR